VYDPRRKYNPLSLRRRIEYYGFELERESEDLRDFPPELAPRARRVLAEAVARGEARHPAANRNRAAIDEIREIYRRSGGRTPRLGFDDLAGLYEAQLADVSSIEEFRATPLRLDLDALVSEADRERYGALPDTAIVRDREVEIDYDVEEDGDGRPVGVARLRLPEKIARTLTEPSCPSSTGRCASPSCAGQRGSVRARTLDDLQELLEQPWSPDEAAPRAAHDDEYVPRDERRARDAAAHAGRQGRGGDARRGGGSGDARRGGGGGKRGGPPGGGKGIKRRRGR
jgi:hypothetical protein